MAILIPSSASLLSKMTPGERRFATRLQAKLEDDYICWYDLPVGQKVLRPDFVILNPRRGLLLLEIKDWKLSTIRRITKDEVSLITSHGEAQAKNPYRQVEEYAHALVNDLRGESMLLHRPGSRRHGQLAVPYGYGVVFTHITRAELDATDICEVIPAHCIICKDEFTEAVDAEALQQRFWQMFRYALKEPLSKPQVDRIRARLYPEICIESAAIGSDSEVEEDAFSNIVRIMDLRQEEIARNLGDGHRIIHGVAGSGKTLLLGYRCLQLAKTSDKPILVLCFNVTLAAKLTAFTQIKGIADKVSVQHFHGWCKEQLQLYHVPKPELGDNYFERLVAQVIDGVVRGQIPAAQYDAVLIDEGHDFEPSWYQLIARMVNPKTDSLLVLYDSAQAIYKKKGGFSFASVGIKARGRTTVLRINYRNTLEILQLAYDFAREFMTAEDEDTPLVEPESAGRHGPTPELTRFPNIYAELNYIVQNLHNLHANGTQWQHIAILYRTRWLGEEVTKKLRAANIPVEWLQQSSISRSFKPDHPSVKVLTMHSSKGLEFPVVFIPNAGHLPKKDFDLGAESKLLYVAMTRAFDRLLVTWHRDTALNAKLQQAAGRQAA